MSNYSCNVSVLQYDGLLIQDSALFIFQIVFTISLFGALSVVGLGTNLLNMVIYVQLVLKDSMTVGFFALSFTDFVVSVLELTIAATYLADVFSPCSPVDLWALAYVRFGWSLYAGYLISSWITTVISVERCMCVVSPFRVKRIFTRGRCAVVIVIIYVIHIATFLPVYVVERMQWVVTESQTGGDNRTVFQKLYYTVVFTEFSDQIEAAVDVTSGLFLFLASQAVLMVCSVWMAYSLTISSTVRTNRSIKDETVAVTKSRRHRLTTQEQKLIRLVLSLAVLHSVCNLPRLAVTVFYNAYPRVDAEYDKRFYTVLWTVAALFNHICSSTDTCCYYFLNSSYRKTFRKKFALRLNES